MRKIIFFLISSVVSMATSRANINKIAFNTEINSPETELVQMLVDSGIYNEFNASSYVYTLEQAEVKELLKTLKNEQIIQAGGPTEFSPVEK